MDASGSRSAVTRLSHDEVKDVVTRELRRAIQALHAQHVRDEWTVVYRWVEIFMLVIDEFDKCV
jgi:hypothetical protein